ncbi:MAG: TlpA disulfide reductase family protein [Myxococcota bacterium]
MSTENTSPIARRSFVPPPWAVGLLVVVTLGGASFFVAQGLDDLGTANARLTAELLDVKTRAAPPLDFELETMDGQRVRLSSLRDKTVFLNFWATWCPPCVEEMPSLRRLYGKLQEREDFVFLAVSTDDAWPEVKKFFEAEPAQFPVLLDAKGEIARKWGTTKFPETYVIHQGEVVGHIVGPRDWDDWFAEAWLREVL